MRDAESAARLVFVSVAVWWLAFSLPLFGRVAEPGGTAPPGRAGLAAALRELRENARALGRQRDALLFLLAFVIYSDAIGTIIRLAVAYAATSASRARRWSRRSLQCSSWPFRARSCSGASPAGSVRSVRSSRASRSTD